ncbi:MAG: AraC family transcriptional regulator [Gemmatimonadetes bacterium]|nr:AraC family transcriptional regulator [Gemmatimonadota bacterium]
MGVIATLLPTTVHLQRLRTAIRDRHQVVACDDWSELLAVCERQPVRLAVVDLFTGGKANFERVRHLKQRLPRLTLIAYVAFSADRAHDFFDAGRQGMDGLVIADQDDSPRALLALVEHAEARSLGAVVRRSLADIEPTIRDAVLLAVTRAHERLSPEGLARLLALPRRTVSQRLADAGFPPPQRLLTWGRLIVAAHLLEDRHRSADRIATALDFPSGSAFRNTCQRYLHATPKDIRARGGAAYVIRAMLNQAGNSPQQTPERRPGKRALALAV